MKNASSGGSGDSGGSGGGSCGGSVPDVGLNGEKSSNVAAETRRLLGLDVIDAISAEESRHAHPLRESASTSSPPDRISTHATLAHFVKCFVGPATLALPAAVARVGLLVAGAMIPLYSLLLIYCLHCLVSASRFFCALTERGSLDYGDTFQFAFAYGPNFCAPFAKFAHKMLNSLILLQQWSILIFYFIFIGENIREIIDCTWPVQVYISLTFPLIILVIFVRNVELLAIVSCVGIAVQLLASTIIFAFLLQDFLPMSELDMVAPDPIKYPVFFATLIFSFEGSVVVLPLENKMALPEEMTSPFGVTNVGITLSAIFYFSFAFFGYLRFGRDSLGAITLNLPKGLINDSLKGIFSCAVVSSYAIQFFVAHGIVFGGVKKWIVDDRHLDLCDFGLRVVVVVCSAVIAAAFPHIGPFISLVGILIGCPLSVTIPIVIDLLRRIPRPEEAGRLNWRLWLDALLLVFSVFAVFVGTTASVNEILAAKTESCGG